MAVKTGRLASVVLGLSAVAAALLWVETEAVRPEAPMAGLRVVKNAPVSRQPDFDAYTDVAEKKEAFFNFLRPMVEAENRKIAEQRAFIQRAQERLLLSQPLSEAESTHLSNLAGVYGVEIRAFTPETLDDLLVRVDEVPTAMVLVQAANETGWGSSRFAREGQNYFGQWCFRKGCGLVPNQRQGGMNHEVARFDSVQDSVSSYLRNLNTNPAYRELRDIRQKMRLQGKTPSAEDLIPGLIRYSERKEAYIDELLTMLNQNRTYLL
ncbi:glucosaminidase domain-containing protein [Ferrimonas balearica]|uniref:glucosaminidase domain-containing protein n=1 Tax=Ferrimonas balearica TaxID=44012 RepID=UPI001C99B051|nr:glucosaminidase domain-containing protein [Ferrimonas balearica]MBY5920389.1 glucosaminidase domain-containing protein [Ferrimonas balearica]MBY5996926.1 glucosaminidase domain-containing protein [Ferrimonas balearica]